MTHRNDRTAVRAYRSLACTLLPPRFRDAYVSEMTAVFAEIERSARLERGARGAWTAVAAELPGLVRLAVRERRAERMMRARRDNPQRKERMLESLAQDLRFAGRSLRRAPGFAAVALFTLALGVGANTAIFSVVNGVLLAPLPLRDPSRLVAAGEASPNGGPNAVGVTSPANFYDWQASAKTMRVAGFAGSQGAATGRGEPQQLAGTTSIGGVMELLGVQPLFGRLLTVADEDPGAPRVIVLNHASWKRLYGEDRGIIGSQLTLNGSARTIVGVMPPSFTFPGAPNDYWVPSRYDAAFRANRDQYYIQVVGRLLPAVNIEQARAEMATIATRLERDYPEFNAKLHIVVQPLRDTIVGGVQTQLYVLMGAVGFVLLITCANLGSLLLARASVRRREIAIRQALGAGRWRVVRQLLTESILLALGGGTLGLVVGKWFLNLMLAAQATTNLPRVEQITLDGRVLAFTFAISIFAGLFFGCIPAWQLARARSTEALREGTRGSGGRQWARNALVVSELALAMVLLTGAGLLLRSFDRLQRVDPGVKTDHVLTFTVRGRTQNPGFVQQSIERIRSLPGVRAVAIVSQLPISGRGVGAWFNRMDRPLPAGTNPTGEAYRVITPDYFATIDIALKRGRLLTTDDRKDVPAVVINEALLRKYYPGENPLGKRIYLGSPDNRLVNDAPIVGVVSDTHDGGLGSDPIPTVYVPLAALPSWTAYSYVIRTAGDPVTVTTSAREVIKSLDPMLPIQNVQTLDDILATSVAPAKWSTTLLAVFAGVALVMAVLGVFGVLSFVVTQRTRELGIRIALGASAGEVRRMVVRRGMALVGAGLGLGMLGAVVLTRFMGTLLYGVTVTDPVTYVGVMGLLAGAALVASDIPARRATRVDPIVALRAE